MWFKGMISKLDIMQEGVTIHCDSQSAIHFVDHQIYHKKTKHINIRLHFVTNIIESREVRIMKVAFEENLEDVFTKPLPRSIFK